MFCFVMPPHPSSTSSYGANTLLMAPLAKCILFMLIEQVASFHRALGCLAACLLPPAFHTGPGPDPHPGSLAGGAQE
jgi:hypothetical protein